PGMLTANIQTGFPGHFSELKDGGIRVELPATDYGEPSQQTSVLFRSAGDTIESVKWTIPFLGTDDGRSRSEIRDLAIAKWGNPTSKKSDKQLTFEVAPYRVTMNDYVGREWSMEIRKAE
ncbi:MAG: hypothetical protein ACPG4T_17460, partial [Nannocystaceae bacterium]